MTGDMSPDSETMDCPIHPHWLKHSLNFNNLSLTILPFQYHVCFYMWFSSSSNTIQKDFIFAKAIFFLQTALCLWCIFSEFALSKVKIKARVGVVVNWNNNGIWENWQIKSERWHRGLWWPQSIALPLFEVFVSDVGFWSHLNHHLQWGWFGQAQIRRKSGGCCWKSRNQSGSFHFLIRKIHLLFLLLLFHQIILSWK